MTTSPDEPQRPLSPDATGRVLDDVRAVNEQLLLAGMREQQLAEQLGRQLAFTTAITTSLGDGICVFDVAGRCTFVNPAAERLLDWTGDDLRGRLIGVIFPVQETPTTSGGSVPAPLLQVLHVGTPYRNEEALLVRRDGGTLPTAYSAAPMIADGQIVGAVVTFRDMSEVRRLQRVREEYLALISHDLRAPLTTIYGRAQLLVRRLTEQGMVRDAASAQLLVDSSRRMNMMLEDLVQRSRTDAAVEAQHRVVVDLVALVQQMLDQTIAPDERARVTFEAVPALLVRIDVMQIERVVVNLLTNALKFSRREQPIVVRVYEQGSEALIAVVDQGIGIAPEDLRHLFKKHYRAHAAEPITGNGLGLYSSWLSVAAHGGRLWAESVAGTGSTFIVALPLPV